MDDIIISSELISRPMRQGNIVAETAALRSLAALLGQGKDMVLKRLANLAIELCGAGSAGISVLEDGNGTDQVFRWQVLAGAFEPYQGGETPRGWSPCGTCLDAGKAMLYSYPARHFTYFQKVGIPIVEGLVIPLYVEGKNGATIWIVSHTEDRHFDAEDVRVMTALGGFAMRALRLVQAHAAHARERDGGDIHLNALVQQDALWREYIRRVATGDQYALTALFNETSPLVFTTALRVLGFRSEAEEITTDVYATVWRAARGFDTERGSVAGWLGAIARNHSFDRLRSELVRSRCEIPISDYRTTPDIEGELIAGQARETVLAALHALPPPQRVAIELRYFSGLTCPEIAKKTGQTVGTVGTRIRLGLQKLRRLLAAAA